MKVRFAAALFTLALVMGSAASAAPNTKAMLAPIDSLVAALNAVDAAAVGALYTADGSLLDEFPPFQWHAPRGAVSFMKDFGAFTKAEGASDFVVKRSAPKTVHPTKDGAMGYLVVPMTITYKLKGKPQTEMGLWTFIVVKAAGSYKIKASAWATISDTGG
ncbi:MAG: hypothetical protein GIW95_12755 [Candidatus Eremiobacteraeota bacterium]|nr:hypothetical protein [Candidatus Eremiobacteraeota bacterium]